MNDLVLIGKNLLRKKLRASLMLFSILIAFIVIGIFLFRIRERFDTVDVQALDRFRGERR